MSEEDSMSSTTHPEYIEHVRTGTGQFAPNDTPAEGPTMIYGTAPIEVSVDDETMAKFAEQMRRKSLLNRAKDAARATSRKAREAAAALRDQVEEFGFLAMAKRGLRGARSILGAGLDVLGRTNLALAVALSATAQRWIKKAVVTVHDAYKSGIDYIEASGTVGGYIADVLNFLDAVTVAGFETAWNSAPVSFLRKHLHSESTFARFVSGSAKTSMAFRIINAFVPAPLRLVAKGVAVVALSPVGEFVVSTVKDAVKVDESADATVVEVSAGGIEVMAEISKDNVVAEVLSDPIIEPQVVVPEPVVAKVVVPPNARPVGKAARRR